MTEPIVQRIRKYIGGGLADLDDPGIPQAQVEVYLRAKTGETFYVSSLAEGIAHLLSRHGYRLSVSFWPDGAGFNRQEWKITIWRLGDELACQLSAPMLQWSPELNQLAWDLERAQRVPDPEQLGTIEVVSLEEILGLSEPKLDPYADENWEELTIEEVLDQAVEAARWEDEVCEQVEDESLIAALNAFEAAVVESATDCCCTNPWFEWETVVIDGTQGYPEDYG